MSRSSAYIIVYSTFPDLKTAKKLVRGLVTNKLAACGNIFKLTSIYSWKNKIEQSPEYGALIKTRKRNYEKALVYLQKNHPYEVPEIISWDIEKGFKKYLDWIYRETK